jgi:2',3'-cyclic-nucleotide 2'-phosphodiesterase (5'-nucleotidase family)
VETKTNLSSSVYGASSIADDPFVMQVYKKYFTGDDPYTTVLGKNATTRSSGVIGQEVANQYLEFGQEHWSEYNIVLAGGSLNTRPPYKLYSGDVTYAELFTLLPFDNSLVLGKISGSKLRQRFINSNSYSVATSSSMPTIKDSATYYIVVVTYTAYYAYNGITVVDRYDNYYARDLLADFIRGGGWD